jgi:hypothetical protein
MYISKYLLRNLSKKDYEFLKLKLMNKKQQENQEKQLNMHDVMRRCIDFYNWADSKYAYNLKGRFYKNTYQLEYGEGISHEAAYLEFCNENVA